MGDDCGAPSALQTFAQAVDGAQQFATPLQERWELPARPLHAFEAPLIGAAALDASLRAFLRASADGVRLSLPPAPASLAPEDHARFLARTAVLARQFSSPSSQANALALAASLHVDAAAAAVVPIPQAGVDEGWSVGAHAETFERAWGAAAETAIGVPHAWAAEFVRPSETTTTSTTTSDFEAVWAQSAQPQQSLETAWAEAVSATAAAADTSPEAAAAVRTAARGLVARAGEDPLVGNTRFMNFMRQLGAGTVEVRGNGVAEAAPSAASEGVDWAEAFAGEAESARQSWTDEFSASGETALAAVPTEAAVAIAGDYAFSPPDSNPFVGQARPFDKARELYAQGRTADTVLALEAAVQQEPTNAAAWRLLGIALADGDDDQRAISALSAARRIDPGNLETLMALAVSFANDLHKDRALEAMREWLRLHPRYHSIPVPRLDALQRDVLAAEPGAAADPSFRELLDTFTHTSETLAMFNAAAASSGGQADAVDPDVHIALGLLYNLNYEFDRAAERFRAAIEQRPTDHLLWNKLGASLANANRNEEAVEAYRHALQLRPGYVRAHSNLAIAMLSLRNPAEAAREFLRALELDGSADHIWDNLALALRMLHREDLVPRIELRNPDFFRADFDF